MLEARNSALEAAKARIAELESVMTRRDMIIADQKRVLKQVKEEYQEKLEVRNIFMGQFHAYKFCCTGWDNINA